MHISNAVSLNFETLALHIPDGFLSTPIALLGWALAIIMIGMALRQTSDQFGERRIPLLGIMAAFVFAAQAINFPVAAGTSGHLLGGALTAIVLGPWAAVLVMTAVVGLQALLFQDGGLLVMGWNLVNIGVLAVFSGALIYRLAGRWIKAERTRLLVGGMLGAWFSVEVGAAATAVELAASGTSPIQVALPAMVVVHAFIGLGEGLITLGALLLVHRTRPDLLSAGAKAPGQRSAAWLAAALTLALVVATFSFAASDAPDGLERLAVDQGFIDKALDPVYEIIPDYSLPFIEDERLSGSVAVVSGTLLLFGLVFLVGRLIRRARKPSSTK